MVIHYRLLLFCVNTALFFLFWCGILQSSTFTPARPVMIRDLYVPSSFANLQTCVFEIVNTLHTFRLLLTRHKTPIYLHFFFLFWCGILQSSTFTPARPVMIRDLYVPSSFANLQTCVFEIVNTLHTFRLLLTRHKTPIYLLTHLLFPVSPL